MRRKDEWTPQRSACRLEPGSTVVASLRRPKSLTWCIREETAGRPASTALRLTVNPRVKVCRLGALLAGTVCGISPWLWLTGLPRSGRWPRPAPPLARRQG